MYDLNSEFDVTPSAGLFFNDAHGVGPDFSQSGLNGPSIFPVTSLGIRAQYQLKSKLYLRSVALDGAPGHPEKETGTHVVLHSQDGFLLACEIGLEDAELFGASGLKASLGYWTYTTEFERINSPGTGKGSDGYYALLDVPLFRKTQASDRGLSWFVRYGIAEEIYNPIGNYLGTGLVLSGPLRKRPDAQLGVAVAHARNGDPFLDASAMEGEILESDETAVEITYRASLKTWLVIQPNLHYIFDPGMNPELQNAFAASVRIELAF